MEYRNLGKCGLKVSELCLGSMQFGWTADEDLSNQILDAAVESGINFIDTANIWPDTKATRRGCRNDHGKWMKRNGSHAEPGDRNQSPWKVRRA
jgi:aryl-alcohol dehydrogenase-like predicted oxidoreductase